MDAKSVGSMIAKLRKKSGMTQIALAQRLNISSKTVSKWENGQGYPDITTFPLLSSLFGVSIDYLMQGEKKGITVIGNLVVDVIKNVEVYPKPGRSTYVSDVSISAGGCMLNIAMNLAKIDSSVPIRAFGKVGTDEYGRYLVSQLSQNGVNTEGIRFSDKLATSVCDVVNISSDDYVVFHKKGAGEELAPEDININTLNCSMLHVGRALQLDLFDKNDSRYGTVMAGFLHRVQKRGIKTSISITSHSEQNYNKKIIPALKYCNCVVMTATVCCKIHEMEAFDAQGRLNRENLEAAMKKTAAYGITDKVIVQTMEASFILDVGSGEITEVAMLNVPKGQIKSNLGADDAFCAGCLYGIFNGFGDKQILEFASAAKACSMFAENSIDGMKSKFEILDLYEKYDKGSL